MSFNFPILLVSKFYYLYGYIKYTLGVVLGNSVEHVKRVDSNVSSLVGDSNKSVVEEHIKPGFIELLLLSEDMGLAGVHELFILEVSLQTLYDLYLKFLIVRGVSRDVSVDDFTDLLSLVRALTDQRAVTPEQVLGEELKEVSLRTVFVFVDTGNQNLSEEQSVGESTIYRA